MDDSTEGNEEFPENSDREAKFFHACSIGDEEEAEKWIQKMCNINHQNLFGQTGLLVAAHLGYIKIVHLLLNCGADHNLVDAWGYNALMKAAACGHTAVFRLLLKESDGSLLCNTFLGKLSALTEAAAFGRTEIVKLCLEHEKLILDSPVELSGMTPLMLAVLGGHYNTVEILLENGANMLIRNSSSQTAKEIAINLGDKNMIKLLESYSFSTRTTHSVLTIPEIVISCVDKNNGDNDILQKQIFLTPTSRLPVTDNERQLRMNSIVQHIKRRSKSCDNTKRKTITPNKSEGLFHYILQSDGLDKYWHLFKEHESSLYSNLVTSEDIIMQSLQVSPEKSVLGAFDRTLNVSLYAIDLKIFFTLNKEDFQSIGVIDPDVLDKLSELSYHYESLFSL